MSKCLKKRKFRTEEEATSAMARVPIRPTGQMPIAVYYCKDHRGWHYTSKSQFKER